MTKEEFGYENDTRQIWIYQLQSSFHNANLMIEHRLGKRLAMPAFVINQKKWGMYSPDENTIYLSETLFRNFEWGAVEHVLRHEMAHMVVDILWDMDDIRRCHGEAFKKACKVLDCDDRRCASEDFLLGFKGSELQAPIVNKVRKLMVVANDDAATEAEAEAFLKKAQALMMRHNITNFDVSGTEQLYIKRPVGGSHKRFPSWMFDLGRMVKEHYNVNCIRSWGTDGKHMELFGEPSNLDVAEYIFHAIASQGEMLYRQHKNDPNRERTWSKLTKAAFMDGLIEGYAEKLSESKDFVDERMANERREKAVFEGKDPDAAEDGIYDLIDSKDQLLQDAYSKAYPNLHKISRSGPTGSGRNEGRNAGRNLKIAKGVSGSSGRTLRLNG